MRQAEEWERDVRLEENKLRILAGAVHSAAGNRKGASQASRIKLMQRRKYEMPTTRQVMRGVGVDPVLGMYTPEEIEAAAQKYREDHDG